PERKRRSHFVVAERTTNSFVVAELATFSCLVLVDEADGSRRLPWVDDWDGNLDLMRPPALAAPAGAAAPDGAAGDSGEAGAVGSAGTAGGPPLASLGFGLPPLTVLNCWAQSRRSEGDHEQVDTLYLCEPLTGDNLEVPG